MDNFDLKKYLAENKLLKERAKYENNMDTVETDAVLKYLKSIISKMGDTPTSKAIQYYMGSLKSPMTSKKDGYDKGGSTLKQMLDKLPKGYGDGNGNSVNDFLLHTGKAFDSAAALPSYKKDI